MSTGKPHATLPDRLVRWTVWRKAAASLYLLWCDRHSALEEVRVKPTPLVFVLLVTSFAHAQQRPPIIDMHMHAMAADAQGPPPMGMCTPFTTMPVWDPGKTSYAEVFVARFKKPECADPVWSPTTDSALLSQTVAAMKRLNMYGVLGGTATRVAAWRAAAPGRFLSGLDFNVAIEPLSVDSVRALHQAGRLDVLAEVTNQYAGAAPDDPRMEPYWQLAEELDIPVGIHVGTGPMGVIYLGARNYRGRLHSALTLEEVLVRHPKLRVYLGHAGYPMLDDLLTLLYAHPQVHIDIGVIVYTQPRAAFYRYLQAIVDHGFASRVMFGSDQMVWPGVIERAVAVIEEAPFLTAQQKRDILYNNAARFLRLSEADISRHHRR